MTHSDLYLATVNTGYSAKLLAEQLIASGTAFRVDPVTPDVFQFGVRLEKAALLKGFIDPTESSGCALFDALRELYLCGFFDFDACDSADLAAAKRDGHHAVGNQYRGRQAFEVLGNLEATGVLELNACEVEDLAIAKAQAADIYEGFKQQLGGRA
jgi:hypothetical protein